MPSTVSSLTVCAPGTVLTGALLAPVTVSDAESVAVLKALAPPLTPTSRKPPLTPVVRSHARKVIALATVAGAPALGW